MFRFDSATELSSNQKKIAPLLAMETTPAQAAEGMAVVHVLAAVLDRLVGANASLARADPGQVTKFHALKAPGIGVLQYLERIHKYASCSTECFILALIYIDRLIQRNNFLLTELNVHRVVITSILLAAKFFDDAYYNNAYYAKVGGVLVSEMNSLEVEFLFRINFSLHVAPDLFHKYHAELVSHAVSAGLKTKNELHPLSSVQVPLQTSPQLAATTTMMSNASNTGASFVQPTSHQQQLAASGHTRHQYPSTEQLQQPTQQQLQQITPSPPPPTMPHSCTAISHGSTSCYEDVGVAQCHAPLGSNQQSSAPLVTPGPIAVPVMHHDHFAVLQRHSSMPLTNDHSSHTKLGAVSQVIVPTGDETSHLGRHSSYGFSTSSMSTSSTHSPEVSDQSLSDQFVIVENGAFHGHLVTHYQHQHYTNCVGGDISVGALAHPHEAKASAAGPQLSRRHSDISRYTTASSAGPTGTIRMDSSHTVSHRPVITQHFIGGQVLTGCGGGF